MLPHISPQMPEGSDRSVWRKAGRCEIESSLTEPRGESPHLLTGTAPQMRALFNRLHLSMKYYEILTLAEGLCEPGAHEQNLQQAVRHASALIWDILKQSADSLDEMNDETTSVILIALMKLSSRFTFEHSLRVMNWSTALAGKLNLGSDMMEQVKRGAMFRDIGKTGILLLGTDEDDRRIIGELLREDSHIFNEGGGFHDIGKLRIPPEILNKPSPLNVRELSVMMQHPVIGEAILKPIRTMEKILPAVRSHHEKFHGGGYPDGLAGRAIPLIARIICITDSFDAMTSDRPYRKALSHGQAIEELKRGAGTQFDPTLVELFLDVLAEESEK